MGASGSLARPDCDSAKTPAKGFLLAILVVIILSGAMPYLSMFMRSLTWFIWIAIFWIIYRFSKELPLWQLLRPALPYLLWLGFYLIWGLIVAPSKDIAYVLKLCLTTTVIGLCMAIFTARPQHLRTFASAVQFALIGNLLMLVLILKSATFAAIVQSVAKNNEAFELGVSRFGGLWGNPNMAGFICLFATLLSVLAVPWIAWLGRLSCLPLLFYSASRKSLVLYLLILLLYLVVVQGRKLQFWLMAFSAGFLLAMAFLLSDGLRSQSRSLSDNPTLARLTDLNETRTHLKGGQTRLALFHQWSAVLAAEPWYGYGLKAMAGTQYDEKNPEKMTSKGLFPTGTHNTYLGVLVDVGSIGFIWFLLMLGHYAKACLTAEADPTSRWVLLSFLACNLIILFVSHNHLFCFEGQIAFMLFFLLPFNPALQEPAWRQAGST